MILGIIKCILSLLLLCESFGVVKLFSLKSWLCKKQACCTGCTRRPFTAKAPPIGKIHKFRKIVVTFEPVMDALPNLESPKKQYLVYFMTKSPTFNH